MEKEKGDITHWTGSAVSARRTPATGRASWQRSACRRSSLKHARKQTSKSRDVTRNKNTQYTTCR